MECCADSAQRVRVVADGDDETLGEPGRAPVLPGQVAGERCRKAERRVALVKYVEVLGVQHLVVEPLYKALQLCAHDATAAPIALRSIATTSSERLTDPIILPWWHPALVAVIQRVS